MAWRGGVSCAGPVAKPFSFSLSSSSHIWYYSPFIPCCSLLGILCPLWEKIKKLRETWPVLSPTHSLLIPAFCLVSFTAWIKPFYSASPLTSRPKWTGSMQLPRTLCYVWFWSSKNPPLQRKLCKQGWTCPCLKRNSLKMPKFFKNVLKYFKVNVWVWSSDLQENCL